MKCQSCNIDSGDKQIQEAYWEKLPIGEKNYRIVCVSIKIKKTIIDNDSYFLCDDCTQALFAYLKSAAKRFINRGTNKENNNDSKSK